METKIDRILKIFGILLLLSFSLGLMYQLYMEKTFQIYDQTLRFHVRAASDRREEQEIKLKVRDAVLSFLQDTVNEAQDARSLEKTLESKQEKIGEIAEETLRQSGNYREIKVFLTRERFPIRRYGPVVFPAGEYRALRVDIGEARGHNWWCAIFPELCYQGENTMELSDQGDQELSDALSETEKNVLAGKKIKIRFKILEWFS